MKWRKFCYVTTCCLILTGCLSPLTSSIQKYSELWLGSSIDDLNVSFSDIAAREGTYLNKIGWKMEIVEKEGIRLVYLPFMTGCVQVYYVNEYDIIADHFLKGEKCPDY